MGKWHPRRTKGVTSLLAGSFLTMSERHRELWVKGEDKQVREGTRKPAAGESAQFLGE